MKNYVNVMNQLLNIQHPHSECTCFADSELDEEFMCELCLLRLKNQRTKVKRRRRIKDNKRLNHFNDR